MIYICIPLQNAEDTIGLLLWKIRVVMAEFGRDYEILVLDDASTDCTREILKGYRSRLPLRILRNDESVGESAGLESLLRLSLIHI